MNSENIFLLDILARMQFTEGMSRTGQEEVHSQK